MRLERPEVVDPVLEAIQGISDEAKTLLGGKGTVDRQHLIARLEVSFFFPLESRKLGRMVKPVTDAIPGFDQRQSRTPRYFRCFSSGFGTDSRCNKPRTFQPRYETNGSWWWRLRGNSYPGWLASFCSLGHADQADST